MANPVPSMNAMVDSITDAVESALHRGQTAGGRRRHMLQSTIRRVLHDIHAQRIPPRRFNGIRTKGSGGQRPSTPPLLPRRTPRPSSTLPPPMAPALFPLLPPPPLPSSMLARPRNGGGGPLATCHGAPSIPNVGAAAWPPSFAYDFDVVLPLPPQPSGRPSYADAAANRPRRGTLPPGPALGAGFASPSTPGEAAPRP